MLILPDDIGKFTSEEVYYYGYSNGFITAFYVVLLLALFIHLAQRY
jgi:hypothetical protein